MAVGWHSSSRRSHTLGLRLPYFCASFPTFASRGSLHLSSNGLEADDTGMGARAVRVLAVPQPFMELPVHIIDDVDGVHAGVYLPG